MFKAKFSLIVLLLLAFAFTCQAATLDFLSLTTPTRAVSGQTFTASAKMLDSNGNTINYNGGNVVLTWDGSGTLSGTTTATFSNGIATFSVAITVSSTVYANLKATYTSGGSTYSNSIGVNVATSDSTDYTSAWVGTWQVQDGCDVNSCCCLTGSVTVTKSSTNSVFLTGPIKGQCGGSATMSSQVSNINSDTTLNAVILNNPFVLTRNGKELTVVNTMASQCSGRAVKTSDSSITKQSLIFICVTILLSFLF